MAGAVFTCCITSTSVAVNYMHDFDTSMNFTHFSCAARRASWKGWLCGNEVVYYLLLSKAASKKLICGNVKTTENLLLISSKDVKIQWPLNLLLVIISLWIFKHSHIFMVEGRPLVIFNMQCTAWHKKLFKIHLCPAHLNVHMNRTCFIAPSVMFSVTLLHQFSNSNFTFSYPIIYCLWRFGLAGYLSLWGTNIFSCSEFSRDGYSIFKTLCGYLPIFQLCTKQ